MSRGIKDVEANIVRQINIMVARGEMVTWKKIEDTSGFTRSALSKNVNIRKAYDLAVGDSKTIKTDAEKVEDLEKVNKGLKKTNTEYKKMVDKYDLKYTRMLINAGYMGVDIERLTAPTAESMKTVKRKIGRGKK